MRIIKNKNKWDYSYPKYVVCGECESEFECDYEDTYIGALGCRYVRCPCCGGERMLDDGDGLTVDTLRFPTHYFHFEDGVKLKDSEVDEFVKGCIKRLRESKDKDFYATSTGTGDTHVFVFRYDGDEEYFVYVGKNGYETSVPFVEEDYR